MRPLNRPMFRYGGPIKEGIMDGMKDNRQAINTVGSPLAPKDETGRGGYAFPLIPAAIAGLSTLGRFALRPLVRYGANVLKRAPITGKGGQKLLPKPGEGPYSPVKSVFDPNKAVPTKFGSYLLKSPEGRFLTGTAGFAGKAGTKAKGAVKSLASSPLTVGTLGYMGAKSIYDAMTGEKTPEIQQQIEQEGGPPGGGDPGMFAKPKQETVDEDTLNKMNKDRIQQTRERYYKLMGLDKASKDTIANSLIKASQIVQEEGADLKGSLKSGALQNRIIQAIAGEADKDKALKRQIDAAILKGEIEKDIKASDPTAQLNAERIKKQIDIYNKQLSGGDLRDIAQIYLKEGIPLKGQRLFTEATRKGIDTKGILPTDKVDEFLQKNPTLSEAEFVNIYQDQLVEAGKNKLPAGDYVVGGRIITIGEDGKAKSFVF